MELSKVFDHHHEGASGRPTSAERPQQPRIYPTRQSSLLLEDESPTTEKGMANPPMFDKPKEVFFRLPLDGVNNFARLPLRVNVHRHDTTESIIATVKSFYGLQEGMGISFEDGGGRTIIPRFENLIEGSDIHVRVTGAAFPSSEAKCRESGRDAASPRKTYLEEPFEMQYARQLPRPDSRGDKNRDMCPPNNVLHHSVLPRANSFTRGELDAANGYSDSDAGSVSVSSSKRSKADGLASADISLDNIVEGGRRKRAKFESSELPLFMPPQIPMSASISSASPQKRNFTGRVGSPLSAGPFFGSLTGHALPSPASLSYGDRLSAKSLNGNNSNMGGFKVGPNTRNISNATTVSGRLLASGPSNILPTPDPTIGSNISDEDVALQLMRLGGASNMSHGRTSTSTIDDALSGRADATSSVANSEDEESEGPTNQTLQATTKPLARHRSHGAGPPRKKQRNSDGQMRTDFTSSADEDDFGGDSDDMGSYMVGNGPIRSGIQSSRSSNARSQSRSGAARPKSSIKTKSRPPSGSKVPQSPFGDQAHHRKDSISSAANLPSPLGEEGDDLSSKPRCQRCRKSKKGCDRQRPCGRCKDAGIGIEGCISEDEGNGRKGRYGRHMGVSVRSAPLEFTKPADPTLHHVRPPVGGSVASPTHEKAKRR